MEFNMWDVFGSWISIFLTLSIVSYLYEDNPFYKLAEHLFVGVSIGYAIIMEWTMVVKDNLVLPVEQAIEGQNWSELGWYIPPVILSILLLFKISKRYAWLASYPFAFIVGVYTGVNMWSYGASDLLVQMRDTMVSLVEGEPFELIKNCTIALGFITALIYFFFSKEHKGVIGIFSRIGIWFLMISFGATFGFTVQGRVSLAIGRVVELLGKDTDKPSALLAQVHAPLASIISIVILAIGIFIYKRFYKKEEIVEEEVSK